MLGAIPATVGVPPGSGRVPGREGMDDENVPSSLNEGRSVNPGDTAKFCKRAVSGQTIARPRARCTVPTIQSWYIWGKVEGKA